MSEHKENESRRVVKESANATVAKHDTAIIWRGDWLSQGLESNFE